MLLPNSYSFLLVKPVRSKLVIKSYIQEPATDEEELPSSPQSDSDEPQVSDKHKRLFLKLAGIAGGSIIGSLLFPKKAEGLILGSSPTTGVVGVKDAANARINPATEETAASLLKTADLTFDTGNLQVKVSGVSGEGSSSYSDASNAAKSGLVDSDRHVQVDVLSSSLPSSASTETTLQTIADSGFKYTLRLATDSTDSNIEYVGEASIGTAASAASWRIKRLDSTTGIIIQWADGDAGFNNIWNSRESLSYV